MAKILIADDERSVLLTIQHLLNANGYETVEATNGLAALELFQTQFFDLIITDLKMPRMDGMTFLYEVRKLDPTTPIVILTAFASTEITDETLINSSFMCLTKPFKADELINLVKCSLRTGKNKDPVQDGSPCKGNDVQRAS